MRVVAGKYKGKILKSPISDNIRPTGDKVKQALFTKLQFFVKDANVLDLFSGSGALGIEALSQGAKSAIFVDKDRRSIALTKENLKGIEGNYSVFCCDYKVAPERFDTKFDLILLDPPYKSGQYEEALNIIHTKDLLSKNGIIVCEHPNDMELNSNFEVFDQKRYGTVMLTFLKKDKNE